MQPSSHSTKRGRAQGVFGQPSWARGGIAGTVLCRSRGWTRFVPIQCHSVTPPPSDTCPAMSGPGSPHRAPLRPAPGRPRALPALTQQRPPPVPPVPRPRPSLHIHEGHAHSPRAPRLSIHIHSPHLACPREATPPCCIFMTPGAGGGGSGSGSGCRFPRTRYKAAAAARCRRARAAVSDLVPSLPHPPALLGAAASPPLRRTEPVPGAGGDPGAGKGAAGARAVRGVRGEDGLWGAEAAEELRGDGHEGLEKGLGEGLRGWWRRDRAWVRRL